MKTLTDHISFYNMKKQNGDEYLLFCGHDIKLPPKSQKKPWGRIVHAVHAALRNNVCF